MPTFARRTIMPANLMVLLTGWLFAQSRELKFEVAVIKPSGPDARTQIQPQPDGDLRVTNGTLKMLISMAYNDVRDNQISGGPKWIDSDRYDILAKAERSDSASASPDPAKLSEDEIRTIQSQVQQRLRVLLAERFSLVVHRETREAPVYALVVGKNGPKLQPAQDDSTRSMRGGRGIITAQNVPLQILTNLLVNQLGRPVVDQTGLKGGFDFKLEWTPDPGLRGSTGAPGGADAPAATDPSGPSLFTAIQEQLGLRLESQKGPIEMIVIDRAERPSEN